MTLGVFWLKCGSKHGNFGDVLTPLLLDYLNVRYRWAPPERADLVGIGSICHKVPEDFQGAIWSAGNICESQYNFFPSARVVALRGELTLRHTKCDHSNAIRLGDGGLLADVMAPRVSKQYLLGVIPHYVDTMDPGFREFVSENRGTYIIDICDHPREVIGRVAQCEFILSSSLHGLILADSLGIPNKWIRSRRALRGGEFKFHDYYSVLGVEDPSPWDLKPTDCVDDLMAALENYHRPGLSQIKCGLWDALSDLVGARGQSGWESLAVPASLRSVSVEKRLSHATSTDCESTTTLREAVPSLRACSVKRKEFIVGCLDALEELWEGGIYHRDIHVENISLVNQQPRFTKFDWSLQGDAVITNNPLMHGNRELRRRDVSGLGQVFAAICSPEDYLMQMVIQMMARSKEQNSLTCMQELRVLLEAALEDSSADDAIEDDRPVRLRVMHDLLGQLAVTQNQCTSLKRKVRELSHELWRIRVEQSIVQLCSVIPAKDSFVLVDEASWSDFVFPDRKAIPFSEQAGEYAGMPVDGQAAVAELERKANLGATHVVIPADNWWCLEHYPELSRFLECSAAVAIESPQLRVYRFSHVKQASMRHE